MAVRTPEAFASLCNTFSSSILTIVNQSLNTVAKEAQDKIKQASPKDKGDLQRGITKDNPAADTSRVYSKEDYGLPVDHGHKTRQGTGKAPGYVPKPGGKTFVPANPFFTNEVNAMKNGKFIKQVNTDFSGLLIRTFGR